MASGWSPAATMVAMRDRRVRQPGEEAGELYPTGTKPGAATLTRHLPSPRPRPAPSRVDPMIGDGGGGGGDGDDDDRDRGRPLFPDEPPVPWMSAAPDAVPGTPGLTVAVAEAAPAPASATEPAGGATTAGDEPATAAMAPAAAG